jgi:hypothetical protein
MKPKPARKLWLAYYWAMTTPPYRVRCTYMPECKPFLGSVKAEFVFSVLIEKPESMMYEAQLEWLNRQLNALVNAED